MAEIVVVRHAEPERRGAFWGATDLPLSAAGVVMAAGLRLPEYRLYCSPLQRARQTAEAAGRRDYTVIEELREIDYGPWEGLRWAEIEARYPEEAARKLADWTGYDVAGAEPWGAFRERVARGLKRVETPAVVVAHVAVNGVLRELLTGEPASGFAQGYCEMVVLRR